MVIKEEEMFRLIGFIGLGIMGSGMAGNLLKSGQELVIYNRTKQKADHLLHQGAKWADSPEEVAAQSKIIFTMLATPKVVEEVTLGEKGFLNQLTEGSLWVDCSTVDPGFTQKMALEAEKRHLRFLDAPVSGSRGPAEKGELVFFVGGKQEDLNEVMPLLEAMGKQVLYQGETGKGTSIKLVINLMLAQSMLAFAEAVNLGDALGLSKETVVETLLNLPVTAPALKGKKDKILQNDYAADFPLKLMQKDLQLVSQTAYEQNMPLLSANVAKEIYAMAKRQGFAEHDFSAIFQFLAKK